MVGAQGRANPFSSWQEREEAKEIRGLLSPLLYFLGSAGVRTQGFVLA
jgi:hypothetical protein